MNGLLEVDPSGKEVFQHVFPGQNVWAAHKSRSGEITCFLSPGSCVRLDAKGHELKRFNSGRDGGWTSGIDVMPNGHVIAAQPNRNVVVEFDADGKTVWEAQAPGITSATRLPNGRTLVASHPGRNVIELDRAGKTVWEYKNEYHQFRARRR